MSDDNETYPYTLTISPSERTTGRFEWAIRKHGKLCQTIRPSRSLRRSAGEQGEAALERQIRDDREPAWGLPIEGRTRTG